jgi:hypothetical protein
VRAQLGLALGERAPSVCVGRELTGADRLGPVSAARAPVVLAARDIRALGLPVLAQAPVVTDRGLEVHPIHWPPQIMDHPHAVDHRGYYVLHLAQRRRAPPEGAPGEERERGDRTDEQQPADNVYMLTTIFTSLVMFSATQGVCWAFLVRRREC